MQAAEAARDELPVEDAAGRLLAWARAFRQWSLTDPEGFRLIYGDPVPGCQAPAGGDAFVAGHRARAGLTGLVAAAWPFAEALQSADAYDWSDFDPTRVGLVRAQFPDLPPTAVALALRVWGRLHGLVSLEIYGHLRGRTTDPGRVHRTEIHDLIRSLGLNPPAWAHGPRPSRGPGATGS
ncbi:TetR-like C-terminal domain-containing protein [Embleya scabrispora]|uniref:TetR-like C-terminal domain-containing protein n=1 Tax=Embleya scabrispora TaxID=159449 RepID=UPI00037E6E54|nr:TetR-like C-terminal domain-containing protein [Embleya scabrispora]